ncbi:PREDICTED: ras-related protein Rab-1-like [Amphimedon queenslandica]|uniref:Small monomeric GTPase n=1 Tax=Amphimedon queenslandica TaxID=400682 RepID=A0A1X7SUI4_AMPQE|nr:PREDICTED: ras-related protein Rab-1-like [Amphimedon queenslandica]|eukprot:XP_011408824.1 PREDICTED: ras-related protein Rab-1-like [Amphimedon queenslandica]
MASNVAGAGKQLRIIFVGDSGVGKTSIFKLFENHEVFQSPVVTINPQTIERNIVIGPPHETVKLLIYDTAGHERFRTFTRQYYQDADIAFLVFSITDGPSFHHIGEIWMKEMATNRQGNTEMILIGNKSDLADDRINPQSTSKQFAEQYQMRFIEMSAIKNDDFQKLYSVLKEAVTHVIKKGGGGTKEDIVIINDDEPAPRDDGWCSKC